MDTENKPDAARVHYLKRARRVMSRPRVVMTLLLLVAIPVFISLANRAVHENAQAIRQIFGQ
jgi:hypothetical protein